MNSSRPSGVTKPLPIRCQPTTNQKHTSCLDTLYGNSPEIKITNSFYDTWSIDRQHEIDKFLHKQRHEHAG